MAATPEGGNAVLEGLAERIMLSWGVRRALIAFLAGAVAVLALPPVNFFAVMFVSLPVLVWLIDGASGSGEASFIGRLRPAFMSGWWFGFGYFVAGLWWLGNALLVDAAGMAWALPLAVLGLPAGLAIFYGLAAAFARLFWSDGPGRIAALAAGFGLAEYARTFAFTGFPWNAIGYTAMPVPLLMQSAAPLGLYAINALAVLVFAAPALVATRRGAAAGLGLSLALLLAHAGYGWYATGRGPEVAPAASDPVFRLVQPDVPQTIKWDAGERDRIFATLLELTARPPAEGAPRPTHILWPETSLPFLLTDNPGALSQIADVLQVGQTLVVGAVRTEGQEGAGATRYYNSIYVIDDGGQIVGAADKAHLVPFGEYLPFEDSLRRFGFAPVAATFGGFSAADSRNLLPLPGGISAVVLICYEAIFPDMATINGVRGDILINVTNDAWYGLTPGPYQHLRQAQLRAVETRTPLVRAANNGVSAVMDAHGRILGALALGEQGVLDVALSSSAGEPTDIGNAHWNFWLIFAIMVLAAVFSRKSNWVQPD